MDLLRRLQRDENRKDLAAFLCLAERFASSTDDGDRVQLAEKAMAVIGPQPPPKRSRGRQLAPNAVRRAEACRAVEILTADGYPVGAARAAVAIVMADGTTARQMKSAAARIQRDLARRPDRADVAAYRRGEGETAILVARALKRPMRS